MPKTDVYMPCCIVIFHFLVMVTSFNIDTNYPIFFEPDVLPERKDADYFGYSVGLLQNRNGIYALITAPRANSKVLKMLDQPGVLYSCSISLSSRTQSCTEVVLDRRGNSYTSASRNYYKEKKDGMFLGVSLDIQQNNPDNQVVGESGEDGHMGKMGTPPQFPFDARGGATVVAEVKTSYTYISQQKPVVRKSNGSPQATRNCVKETCGHLWKNQREGLENDLLVGGACYVLNEELKFGTVKKLSPFANFIPARDYGYAQVGISAVFSEDGNYMFLGAPGVFNWKGTVASYSNLKNKTYSYGYADIPSISNTLKPDSYFGYSITPGNFLKGQGASIAVGVPRAKDTAGQVYIVSVENLKQTQVNEHMINGGTQFGEYYGGSVLGVDMNNDGYTDLLVGAPFHSLDPNSGGDEGIVYVYISNGMKFRGPQKLHGLQISNARFGSCISSIGDINQDRFNDVAIGAPYENNEGAVYIYHGTSYGINTHYAQRLQASTISSSLQGFGISISRGLDVDSNGYPDILVGAYNSSKAVLLRTSPIIRLTGELLFSVQQIKLNMTSCNIEGRLMSCFNVTTCLYYSGRHSQAKLIFETELRVDYKKQSGKERCKLVFPTNPTTVMRRIISVTAKKRKCSTDTAFILEHDPKDVTTPVDFLFTYRLPNNTSSKFCKSCPLLDQRTPTNNITKSISFETGCESGVCFSDLVVDASIVGFNTTSLLIIGQDKELTINIDVLNKGEPAYNSELLIYLQQGIVINNPGRCISLSDQQMSEANATLSCDLGNFLQKDKKENTQLKIDISKLPWDTEMLIIDLETKSDSEEIESSDNNMKLINHFKSSADIEIRGIYKDEMIQYDEIKKTPLSMSHTYFIKNHGPSPIDVIEIELRVPIAYRTEKGKDAVEFIAVTDLQTDSGELLTIPATCNSSITELIPGKLDGQKSEEDIFNEDDIDIQKRSIKYDETFPEKRKAESSIETAAQSTEDSNSHSAKKNYVVSCEKDICMIIQCTASPFPDSQKFAKLTVTVQLNISLLEDILDSWYQIEIYTDGKVSIRDADDDIQPQPNLPDEASVKTIVVRSRPIAKAAAEPWIIYVSVGIGLLLLIILLIILVKVGFFKRQQQEKMRKMKADAEQRKCDSYLTNDDFEINEDEALHNT